MNARSNTLPSRTTRFPRQNLFLSAIGATLAVRAHTRSWNAIQTRWQGGYYFPCRRNWIECLGQKPHGLDADRLALGQQFHDMRARPEADTGHANPYVHVPRARVRRRRNRDSVNPVHLHPERPWASVVADKHRSEERRVGKECKSRRE